jgi:hypothetical protein
MDLGVLGEGELYIEVVSNLLSRNIFEGLMLEGLNIYVAIASNAHESS